MKKPHYVIVGNGVAAAGCIEGIRSVDESTPITVISQENYPVYCRPLISYLLEGKTTPNKMLYRPDDFYKRNGCEVLYNVTATELNPAKNSIALSDGQVVSYSALMMATGSAPFVPAMQGLESVKEAGVPVVTFMTLDDAYALDKAITSIKQARVLIVGAGLIGLKCAEGIRQKVSSITVCDLAPRVLSSILDDTCATLVEEQLRKYDIQFLLGDTVDSFSRQVAHMKSGTEVEFDVLVLAVGVRANTGLVKNAGGECNRGILVDEKGKTSLPNVYAAGDCVESEDISLGQKRVMAILPNAYMQGHCAGVNMAGGENTFSQAIPMNSIGFFGYHIMTAGSYIGQMYEEKTDCGIKRLYMDGGYLKGFIIVGETQKAGIYTSLIRNKVPLDTIDFNSIEKIPTLGGFSAEYRGKKLGGVI